MTVERRYQEDEVAEIFEAAATPRDPAPRGISPAEGLTLAELQAIGREVGVAPERIADAAAALDRRRSAVPARKSLGMPVSAARTIDLPRAPTDREWAILVDELREAFGARGTDGSRGEVREWTDGSLHASVVPTEEGYRFRLRTEKGDAVAVNVLGIFILLAGLVVVLALSRDEPGDAIRMLLVFGLAGAATLVFNAQRLSRWALEREEQMEHVAARARALIGRAPGPEVGAVEA